MLFGTCKLFRPIRIVVLISKMSHHVFVYGTLKRDEPNHYWLTSPENGYSKFICEGVTKTKYPLIIATKYNIPFLLYAPGVGHNVRGEIYEVDDVMLSKLDILEDHPKYYERMIDQILINKTDTLDCWVYFLKSFRKECVDRPKYENYSSGGPHGRPYMERFLRDPNFNHMADQQRIDRRRLGDRVRERMLSKSF